MSTWGYIVTSPLYSTVNTKLANVFVYKSFILRLVSSIAEYLSLSSLSSAFFTASVQEFTHSCDLLSLYGHYLERGLQTLSARDLLGWFSFKNTSIRSFARPSLLTIISHNVLRHTSLSDPLQYGQPGNLPERQFSPVRFKPTTACCHSISHRLALLGVL